MRHPISRRLRVALICLLLTGFEAGADVTLPANQSRAAQARRVDDTAQRLCARQAGEARRACAQQFATESEALRAPAASTPPTDTRAAQ